MLLELWKKKKPPKQIQTHLAYEKGSELHL